MEKLSALQNVLFLSTLGWRFDLTGSGSAFTDRIKPDPDPQSNQTSSGAGTEEAKLNCLPGPGALNYELRLRLQLRLLSFYNRLAGAEIRICGSVEAEPEPKDIYSAPQHCKQVSDKKACSYLGCKKVRTDAPSRKICRTI
jgi:hypothetical protein